MQRVFTLLLAAWLVPALGSAEGPAEVGDRIELKARHHDGVPLHPSSESTNRYERVPDGARASVLEIHPPNGWLQLRMDDGKMGWITPSYVGRVLGEAPGGEEVTSEQAAQVWGSPEGCESALDDGGRLRWDHPRSDSLRLATWNIRWFPRGCPRAEDCPENATDLSWLACTIAWMNLDLLAVQEFLDTPDARAAMALLRDELDRRTGGSWQVDLNECGNDSSQHVGFLWDGSRVTLAGATDSCDLNGASPGGQCTDPCASHLRPGRHARAASARPEGADFHLLSAHLDSGISDRDFQNRREASRRIPSLSIGGEPLLDSDQDVLVLGDFNTMGRREPPEVSAALEIELFDGELEPGFRRVPIPMACTEFFRGEGGHLDHIVITAGMAEGAVGARVGGYCAVRECRPFSGSAPMAYERLSDHCPVLFEVRDQDLDEGG